MNLLLSWHLTPNGPSLNESHWEHITILENKSARLVFEGVIFKPDADELLKDESGLDNAYGVFSYVLHRKPLGECIVGTDRFGFSPIYYAQEGNVYYVSSSLTRVKNCLHAASIDYEAWDEILNLGDILGNKTTVREIRRLGPGQRIHLSRDGMTVRDYCVLEFPTTDEIADYCEHNNRLLSHALELTRGDNSPKVILLSGGEDSRRLAVTAKNVGLEVLLATQEAIHGGSVDDDVLIAEQVANHLSLPLLRHGLPTSAQAYANGLWRDWWLGFETHQHAWLMPLLQNLPAHSLIYDGIVGDVTVNGHYFRLNPSALHDYRDLKKLSALICRKASPFEMDSAVVKSSLEDRVRSELSRYPDTPHRLTYYYLMNHTRRNIALASQLGVVMGHNACFPYLYHPLFVQSLTLGPELYARKLHQMACVELLDPKCARIPSTRCTLGPEYKIDLSAHARDLNAFRADHVEVRRDVRSLFPRLSRKVLAHNASRWLGLRGVSTRLVWAAEPLARMSMFMDWMDYRATEAEIRDPLSSPFITERIRDARRHRHRSPSPR